jgi:hypothetical protein
LAQDEADANAMRAEYERLRDLNAQGAALVALTDFADSPEFEALPDEDRAALAAELGRAVLAAESALVVEDAYAATAVAAAASRPAPPRRRRWWRRDWW